MDSIFRDAMVGNLAAIQQAIANGFDVRTRDVNSDTPLHYSCDGGHIETSRALLEAGADPNAANRGGLTSLHYASTPELIRILLASGADPRAETLNNETPLIHLCRKSRRQLAEDSILMLIGAGANVDARGRGEWTPLIVALESHQPNGTIVALISAGADVNALGREGKTPLMYASMKGDAELAKTIIAAGGAVPAQDTNGNTALVFAVQCASEECVRLLVEAGANVHWRSQIGDTLLHSLADADCQDLSPVRVARLLIRNGANVSARNCTGDTALEMATNDDLRACLANCPRVKRAE